MFGRKRDSSEKKESPKFSKESFKKGLEIFQFIKPYRWQFVLGMIFLFLSSSIFLVFPYVFGLMVDIANKDSHFDFNLTQVGLFLLLALPIQGFTSFFRIRTFAFVSENAVADMRKAVYKRLLAMPITFYDENKTGSLLSRLTSDIEKVFNVFSITLAEFIRQIITLLGGICILGWVAPRLSLIMLATIPVVVISGFFFGRMIRKYSKARQKELADSNSMVSESIQSIQIVKAYANEWFELRRYYASIREVVKTGLKYADARAWFAVFILTVFFGAIFFVVWQGALMVEEGAILPGDLVSFMLYTTFIGGAIAGLGSFTTELIGAVGSTERVMELLNAEIELDLGDKEDIPEVDIQGNISFEEVHFHYPTRTDIPVLKGVDMEISSGQKVALVGPSGVGKSTIIQLLLQFYPIQAGDIKIDGKSIYDYDLHQLRNKMALVPQEVILFGGTIRENILYGKEDATDEEVIAAAKKSNSWEFIESFPEGLDTVVGERGVKLSGGQRQRIAIARAILKDPVILLLDEATSALDAESEKVVQDALEKLMEGRTSIIIAHRLSTIKDVDCIFVLDEGKIIEKGRHDELLKLDEGAYSKQAQLAGLN
ncbi:MAG: ABC transporter transmembrane domain-containing protein [Bacteroidota bacterium]